MTIRSHSVIVFARRPLAEPKFMPSTPFSMLDKDAILTLANLVHMMLADGKIDQRETSLIHEVARRLGLVEAPSIDELLDIGLSADGSFSSSRGPQVCLAECLRVASSDGGSQGWATAVTSGGSSRARARMSRGPGDSSAEVMEAAPQVRRRDSSRPRHAFR